MQENSHIRQQEMALLEGEKMTIFTLHYELRLGWVFFELGQNGLSLSWVWVEFNPVKLLKIL